MKKLILILIFAFSFQFADAGIFGVSHNRQNRTHIRVNQIHFAKRQRQNLVFQHRIQSNVKGKQKTR
jgi:hypothetical protein